MHDLERQRKPQWEIGLADCCGWSKPVDAWLCTLQSEGVMTHISRLYDSYEEHLWAKDSPRRQGESERLAQNVEWYDPSMVVVDGRGCCTHLERCVSQVVRNQLSTKSEKIEVWGGGHAEDGLKIAPDLGHGRCREQRVEVQIFSSPTESHSLVWHVHGHVTYDSNRYGEGIVKTCKSSTRCYISYQAAELLYWYCVYAARPLHFCRHIWKIYLIGFTWQLCCKCHIVSPPHGFPLQPSPSLGEFRDVCNTGIKLATTEGEWKRLIV